MKIHERIKTWRKLAQTASPAAPETESAPATNIGQAPILGITQITGFRTSLFSNKPEIAQEVVNVINVVGKYLHILSNGKVRFADTWEKGSISETQYTGALSAMYKLAKWLYEVVSTNSQPYTLNGLRQIGQKVNEILNGMSFSEPQASSAKAEITNASQAIINRIPTV